MGGFLDQGLGDDLQRAWPGKLHGSGSPSRRSALVGCGQNSTNARGSRSSSIPDLLWLDPDRLVADCLKDVAAGKVISIPSKRYKALITICEHLPHRTVRAVSRKMTSSRQ